jgi:hypothetical protein
MSKKLPKQKSFYRTELLPSERKDLALAAPAEPAIPVEAWPLVVQEQNLCVLLAPGEQPSPENALPPPLADEIDLLRVAIRRMFALSREQAPEEAVRTLALLSTTIMRLAGVIRLQQQILYDQRNKRLTSAQSQNDRRLQEYESFVQDVLSEVQQEFKP